MALPFFYIKQDYMMSMHDELIQMYKEMLNKYGVHPYDIEENTSRRSYQMGTIKIPIYSTYLKFHFRKQQSVECAIVITGNNQVFFIYKGWFSAGVRKIFAASTIEKYIKKLKIKGTMK